MSRFDEGDDEEIVLQIGTESFVCEELGTRGEVELVADKTEASDAMDEILGIEALASAAASLVQDDDPRSN